LLLELFAVRHRRTCSFPPPAIIPATRRPPNLGRVKLGGFNLSPTHADFLSVLAAHLRRGDISGQIGTQLRKAEKLGNSPLVFTSWRRNLSSVFKELLSRPLDKLPSGLSLRVEDRAGRGWSNVSSAAARALDRYTFERICIGGEGVGVNWARKFFR